MKRKKSLVRRKSLRTIDSPKLKKSGSGFLTEKDILWESWEATGVVISAFSPVDGSIGNISVEIGEHVTVEQRSKNGQFYRVRVANKKNKKKATKKGIIPQINVQLDGSGEKKVTLAPIRRSTESKRVKDVTLRKDADGKIATLENTPINELVSLYIEQVIDSKSEIKQSPVAQLVSTQSRIIESEKRRRKMQEEKTLIHILLDYRVLLCRVGDECSLYFSLYSNKANKRVTEEFQVCLSSMGLPKDENKIGGAKGLFKGLEEADLQSELYLVCRIIREGKMMMRKIKVKADKKKESGSLTKDKSSKLRRPFGVAVLPLDDSVFDGEEKKIRIWKFKGCEEEHFSSLHQEIINGTNNYEPTGQESDAVVCLRKFVMPFNSLVQDNANVVQGAEIINKLKFPDEISPGEYRNDFYLTIEHCNLPSINSNASLELTATARLDSGNMIHKAMKVGVGQEPTSVYHSIVFYKNNIPVWDETLHLSIPVSEFGITHLHFSLKKVESNSKKDKGELCYAFLRLAEEDGTVLPNKQYVLNFYNSPKMDSTSDIVWYLHGSNDKFIRKSDKLFVSTLLSSSALTQDTSLQALLSWRKNGDQNLEETIKRVTFLEPKEIMKFAKEILNELFSLLEHAPIDKLKIYDVIVYIIHVLSAERFIKILDSYLEEDFTVATAGTLLVNCMTKLLQKSDPSKLRETMKNLEYIFKFIVASRIIQIQEKDMQVHEEFNLSMGRLLEEFNVLVANSFRDFMASQVLLIINYTSSIKQLHQLYPLEQLAEHAATFFSSMPYTSNKKLYQAKLTTMAELASIFYEDAEARHKFMATVLGVLADHIKKSVEEVILCLQIFCDILDYISISLSGNEQAVATWELVPLLPELFDCAPILKNSEGAKVKLCGVIFTFFHLMQGFMFDQYMAYLQDSRGFMITCFNTCDYFLRNGFEKNWPELIQFLYCTCLKVIKILTGYIVADKSVSAWSSLINLCFNLINEKGLQLEKLKESRRNELLSKYGDIRIEVLKIFSDIWKNVQITEAGDQNYLAEKVAPKLSKFNSSLELLNQVNEESNANVTVLIPALAKLCLELFLSPNDTIKPIALQIFIGLFEKEFRATKKLVAIQNATIDNIDNLVKKTNDEVISEFLGEIEKLKKIVPEMSSLITSLLQKLKAYVELINQLLMLPDDETYEDDRVIATMKLMEFLMSTGRTNAYYKYVHLLSTQHVSAENFTEAGLAILLHANQLKWDSDILLPAIPDPVNLPEQTMRKRKEYLLRMAIGYFDKGLNWEDAIGYADELIEYYKKHYQYNMLANLLKLQAKFYESIIQTERFPVEYYRVGYYGLGFPVHLSGKEFIYRGAKLQKLTDFTAYIQQKFPSAEVLKSPEIPSPEVINSDGQYLLIMSVRPCSLEQLRKPEVILPTEDIKIPYMMRRYQQANHVQVFTYSRAFVKEKKKLEDVGYVWVKKGFLRSEEQFPNVNNSLLVVERVEVYLSPILNAISTIEEKTTELQYFVDKYRGNRGINVNPFTMALNGVVDAQVNGGIPKYHEAFLKPEFLQEHPEHKHDVAHLKGAIKTHIKVLSSAVALHKTIMTEDMSGLHNHMEEQFEKLKSFSNEKKKRKKKKIETV